ncbi:MAG: carboxypeptidase-like regulatory domain-containing protein, partial [Bacteroidales bacterium]|nr:carboxypeptidase-like regulatory domain-containing protein [Bacteroidales bacterium]
MKPLVIYTLLMLLSTAVFSQTTLRGIVTDQRNQPLPGANVLIKGSIDGTSTDTAGQFSFKTRRNGDVVVLATFIGYEPRELPVKLEGSDLVINIMLREQAASLADVVITAGRFEASDKKKGVTLKPLDIVTTASAAGDIYGALNTLPGTAIVG